MRYNPKTDQLEPTDELINGDSEVLKGIASNIPEFAGDWKAIWDNILLRAKIKETLVKYSEKEKDDELLEAEFVVKSNDMYHLLSDKIKEETGIEDVEFIPGFRERITYFFRKSYDKSKKPPLVFKEVVFYLVKTKTKQVRISYEHTRYKWLPYNKAIKQITFKNAKDILERANNYLLSIQ